MRNSFPLWLVLSIIIFVMLAFIASDFIFFKQLTAAVLLSEIALLFSLINLLFSFFIKGEVTISSSHRYFGNKLLLYISVNNQTNAKCEILGIEVKGYVISEEDGLSERDEEITLSDNKIPLEKNTVELFIYEMEKQNNFKLSASNYLSITVVYSLSNSTKNQRVEITSIRR